MKEFKRYMVFEYDSYHETGGINDCYFSDDNLDKAKEYSANSEYDHLHIFDRIEGVIVEI